MISLPHIHRCPASPVVSNATFLTYFEYRPQLLVLLW